MKDGKFKAGTIIKGKDLKGYVLCKVVENNGKDTDSHIMGNNISELHFCLIQDICNYMCSYIDYGTYLAIVEIPDNEDVYVYDDRFSTHRVNIKTITNYAGGSLYFLY